MFGTTFYNQTTRRYVALFGTLFNNISIYRNDNDGVQQQIMKVPLNYGPMEKYLARTQQDPNLTAPAMTLPRMSFEIVNINYDGERKLSGLHSSVTGISGVNDKVAVQYSPAPYDLDFDLNIMVKYSEDGLKIVEQILPYFKPMYTVSAKMIDGVDSSVDIPIVLNTVNMQDTYDGSYEERRAIIWTLNFTLKGYYYGPTAQKKIIKFSEVNVHLNDNTSPAEIIRTQPGLTANGQPTTSISQTIPYANINIDDDWTYIVRVETP